MTTPSKMTFVTCLLGAPVAFALFASLFDLGGEYLSRFGYAGKWALIFSLPAWLTAFTWLAWRVAKRGEVGIRPYVFTSMAANAASLVIFPMAIFLAEGMGADLAGSLRESFETAQRAAEAPSEVGEEMSLASAAFFTGLAVFFVGLFTMPIMAALFGWLAKTLKLVK